MTRSRRITIVALVAISVLPLTTCAKYATYESQSLVRKLRNSRGKTVAYIDQSGATYEGLLEECKYELRKDTIGFFGLRIRIRGLVTRGDTELPGEISTCIQPFDMGRIRLVEDGTEQGRKKDEVPE